MRYSWKENGLTVLEILVGVALSLILLTALLRFLVVGFPLARVTYIQAHSTETARVQLKRLSKALRELRQSDTGSYALAAAEPQRIIFYANVDADALTERVRYELAGTDLQRGIIKPSGNPLLYDPARETVTTVAAHIRNGAMPLFTYYNGSYPAETTPLTPADVTEVKYIDFSLVIDNDPATDPPPVTVTSQVQLRNLKNNLAD